MARDTEKCLFFWGCLMDWLWFVLLLVAVIGGRLGVKRLRSPRVPAPKTEKCVIFVTCPGDCNTVTWELTETGDSQAADAAVQLGKIMVDPAVVLRPNPEISGYWRPCYSQTSSIIARHLALSTDENVESNPWPHTVMKMLVDPFVDQIEPCRLMPLLMWLPRRPKRPATVVLVIDEPSLADALDWIPVAPKVVIDRSVRLSGRVFRLEATVDTEGNVSERRFT